MAMTDAVDTRTASNGADVDRRLADPRLLAIHAAARRRGNSPAAAVRGWYDSMTTAWLATEPAVHRHLILQVHLWIEQRVLDREPWPPPAVDLAARGPLYHRLARLVPAADLPRWEPWIARVLRALDDALAVPPSRRAEGWAHGLLQVPLRIPPPLAEPPSLRAL